MKIWTNVGIWLFILLNLVTRGITALLEAVAAPIFIAVWKGNPASSVQDSSNMFLILGNCNFCFIHVLGLIGLVMYVYVDNLTNLTSEYALLAVSFATTGIGALFFINYDHNDLTIKLWQFLIGSLMIWSISSPLTQTLVLSNFSKLLGTKATGTLMGYMSAAASVGRIIFSLLSAMGHIEPFVVSSVLCFVSCGLLIGYKWKLQQLTGTRHVT